MPFDSDAFSDSFSKRSWHTKKNLQIFGTMKNAGTMIRRDEVQFFLQLHGLWEGILALPPPRPPFDIDTLEPLDVPRQWGGSDAIEPPPEDGWRGAEAAWGSSGLPLEDGQGLVLDAGDPFPVYEWPVFRTD